MKRWTPWTVALAAAGIAAAATLWREVDLPARGYRAYVERAAEEALALLADDPLAARLETQRLVRVAAAAAAMEQIDSPEALYLLSMQHQRENNLQDAEQLLRRIIARRPEWSWPYAALGSLLGRFDASRLMEAEQALRQAVALAPDWARPRNALAVTLRLMGRLEEAEEEALIALDLAPDDIAAHNNYANLLVVMERYEEAETHYQYAMHLEPDNAKPPYNLACLHSVMGEEEEALAYLRTAIELNDAMRRDAAVDPYFANIQHLPEYSQLIYEQEARGDALTQEKEDAS